MYEVNKQDLFLGLYQFENILSPQSVIGLSHQDQCMDESTAGHLWYLLKNAIQSIQREHYSHLQFEELYRYGYSLVMHKYGSILYSGLQEVLAQHLTAKVQPKVLANLNSNFLRVLNNSWDHHQACMTMICDILLYMDRVYVPQKKLADVYTLGLNLFKDLVVNKTSIQSFLQKTLLNSVTKERRGELVNRSVFRSTTRMLMVLGNSSPTVYQENFEEPLLRQSAQFFKTESQQLLEENNASIYLRKVENRILEEIERSNRCFDESTTPKITKVVEDELIKAHMKLVVEMSGSGVVEMMKQEKTEDLARLYRLLSRVSEGLPTMFHTISEHIRAQGQALLSDQDCVNDALFYIQKILDMKEKMDFFLINSFSNDKMGKQIIALDFETILNLNCRSPEYLSIFIDDKLKRNVKEINNNEKKLFEKTMVLFRFLQDKDLFEQYYKQHLARRLISTKAINQDNEESLIAKFKAECGYHYTRKMEGMFKDMSRSSTLTEEFRRYISDTGGPVQGVDMSLRVLTKSCWPNRQIPPPCNLPIAPLTAFETFKKFYLSRHCGRQITLLPHMGTAEVEACFLRPPHDEGEGWHSSQTLPCGEIRSYTLLLTTYQMCVLMLFNDRPHWNLQELQLETNILPRELHKTLQSLMLGKPSQRVLTKQSDSNKTEVGDYFYVNSGFSSKTNRVKIPPFQVRYETESERQDTIKRVTEDRNHEVEAAVIRVMKARKIMNYDSLMNEVVSILSPRFIPSKDMVKTRIEVLIEREYIARNPEDRAS